MSENITTFSGFVCLELERFKLAQATQKAQLGDKIDPTLYLGTYATYVDPTGKKYAVWRDSAFKFSALEDLRTWFFNLDVMPVVSDLEKARSDFEEIKSSLGKLEPIVGEYVSADMLIVSQLPNGWQPFAPEGL